MLTLRIVSFPRSVERVMGGANTLLQKKAAAVIGALITAAYTVAWAEANRTVGVYRQRGQCGPGDGIFLPSAEPFFFRCADRAGLSHLCGLRGRPTRSFIRFPAPQMGQNAFQPLLVLNKSSNIPEMGHSWRGSEAAPPVAARFGSQTDLARAASVCLASGTALMPHTRSAGRFIRNPY